MGYTQVTWSQLGLAGHAGNMVQPGVGGTHIGNMVQPAVGGIHTGNMVPPAVGGMHTGNMVRVTHLSIESLFDQQITK